MITPSFLPAETKLSLPRLSLNFTAALLDSRVTITRALNTATAINSSGYIEIVNANLPRFDYTPVTKVCKGLLIEESRTNLLLQTNDFGSASWAKANVTVATNGLVSPDGTLNADTITSSSGAGYTYPANTALFASAGGGTYTFSVYAKAGSTSTFQILLAALVLYRGTFDLSAKTATTNTANTTASIIDAGNGWFRCSVTAASVTNNAYTEMQVGRIGSGLTLGLWGAQLEVGAFATSYIPTTTLAVTRNADVVSMTGTNFSSWWQAGKGSALVKARTGIVSGTRPWVQFDDTTANNIIALRGNATNPELYIRSGGTDQAQIDAGAIVESTIYSLAGAWAADNCAASINSGSPVLDGVATIPTVTQARLGSDGTNYLNGHIEALDYYNERILNATLQVVSSTAGYQSIISPVILDAIIS